MSDATRGDPVLPHFPYDTSSPQYHMPVLSYITNLNKPASNQEFPLNLLNPSHCYSLPAIHAQMPPRFPLLPMRRPPNNYSQKEVRDWSDTSKTGKFKYWSDDRERRANFVAKQLSLWRDQYLADAACYANETTHLILKHYSQHLYDEATNARTTSRRRRRENDEDRYRSTSRNRPAPEVVPRLERPPRREENTFDNSPPGELYQYDDTIPGDIDGIEI